MCCLVDVIYLQVIKLLQWRSAPAGEGGGAYAAWLLVMSHASVAVYITQAVIHQHDRSLLHDMCQQCL